MYATRPLSACRKSTGALEELPNEAEAENTKCCGYEIAWIRKLPFPQDRLLFFQSLCEDPETTLWFIPALDRPLSSNIYYVITAQGKYRGKSCICSRDGDIQPTCYRTSIKDTRPSHFDPRDTYQVFQIHRHDSRSFFAESVAPDGFPPKYLRKKSWQVKTSYSLRPHLEEALGLDMTLRARLPDFTFPISGNHPAPAPIVVGEWYCPCVFVRDEGVETKHQMKKSMFYKMILEQKWEELHTCENNVNNEDNNKARLNVALTKEEASVFGLRAVKDDDGISDGFVWFKAMTHDKARRGIRLGVSEAIAEKMKWVMREGGWAHGDGGSGREVRVEGFKGDRMWKRFGCYVLVEGFVMTRLDGSLVLKRDFRHTHRIRCKWE
ncbi:hypothetical protein ACJRO7_004331 [Eucalyptus globulus]|uniref:Uncharacterized protein n=1 Tax=Eucalyptus globulus TaxID=34317 RepID=A0ABD3IZ32_EUCGL